MLKSFQDLTNKIVNLVNSPSRIQKTTRNAVASRVVLISFCEDVHLADQHGFFAGSLGEYSIRLAGGKFIINPSNSPIARLTEENILIAAIHREMGVSEELPVRHIEWHRMIYKNTSAKTVMICQPNAVCILANQMKKPPKGILNDTDEILDSVVCTEPSDTRFSDYLIKYQTLLIKGIGVLSWGATFEELFDRNALITRLSEIYLQK
jgi:ribulose-5-phosphate 4-epimerase/fuculose-1-phosphate aldolase